MTESVTEFLKPRIVNVQSISPQHAMFYLLFFFIVIPFVELTLAKLRELPHIQKTPVIFMTALLRGMVNEMVRSGVSALPGIRAIASQKRASANWDKPWHRHQ